MGSEEWRITNMQEDVARARIVVADDNKEIRDKAALLLEPEFEVVEMVEDGEALVLAVFQMRPDVCVTDISMPKINGIEVAARLKREGFESKILFLTIHEDPDFIRAALDAGAAGYVVKSRMATDLCAAVKGVINGQMFVSPTTTFINEP
jgi:DNA-binding NarL/FixJ family response regulator